MADHATASPLVAAPQVPPAHPWWMLPIFGIISYAIFAAGMVLAYMLENATLFNVALGAAIGQALTVNNFFFGSSKSSQDKDASAAASLITKDATLAETTKALAVSAPPAPITTTKVEAPDGTTTTTTAPTPPPPIPPEPEWITKGWPSPAGPEGQKL